MQKKQFFASLEIAEDEIRLLVAEYHMSRFNILRSDVQKCAGIKNQRIEKPQAVSASIIKIIRNAEDALGMKIKSVILVIPSVDVKCVRKRVNVATEDGSHKILLSHIRKGLKKAQEYEVGEEYAFVNTGSIKYIVGGISSRTMPLDERTDVLTMDVDLLYANKDVVYSYVMCVEKAGINVLDICLDTYAMAEESAALENSVDKYMVLLDFSRYTTTLSLYYKGSLAGVDSIRLGYEDWSNALRRKFHLTMKECNNIIVDNCFSENGQYDDNISYIWLDHDENRQITKKNVYDAVYDEVKNWIITINEACEAITQNGNCKLIMCGQGADIVGISSLTKMMSIKSDVYVPTTIGARKSSFTATLGSMYCVKKWLYIQNEEESCIEVSNLTFREREREDQNAFTKKLKNILLMNK